MKTELESKIQQWLLYMRDLRDTNGIGFNANDNVAGAMAACKLTKEELIQQTAINFDRVLRDLGIDVDHDHNSKGTAMRYAKMVINETFAGRYEAEPSITDFPNASNLDQLITVGPLRVESMCSHHHQNIRGSAFISVLPDPQGKVIGLSKFSRILRHYARRPQIQEELTSQVADHINEVIAPLGVAVIINAEHQCFDGETEILTEQGWVRFDELPRGLRVAQVDPITMRTTLVEPTDYIIQKNTSGIMHRYKNRRVDIMCTTDHRFLMKTEHGNTYNHDWDFLESENLPAAVYVPTAFNWVGETFELPSIGKRLTKMQFVAFMGLYLSEGCWRGPESVGGHDFFKGVGVEIIQKNGTKDCKRIARFLKESFGSQVSKMVDKRGIAYFFIENEKLAEYCHQFGRYSKEKVIPQIIKNAARPYLEEFIKWYYLGDGHKWHKSRTDLAYSDASMVCTASLQMARDLQEVYAKIGVSMNIHKYEGKKYQTTPSGRIGNKYVLWEQKGKGDRLNGGKSYLSISKSRRNVKYSDMVYCVTVPTGAIVVKRNDKIVVIGNCMACRGVMEPDAKTVTTVLRGEFQDSPTLRQEFQTYVALNSHKG